MALLLKHQTAQQFVARFREAYRNGERERIVQLARFVLSRIQAGDITDAQCRTAFGLNTTQWNTLKTKMQNFVTAHNSVLSAVGE
jgi:precorrin-3B methylase